MQFKDLTFSGLFNITLIVDIVPTLCLVLLFLITYLIYPDKVDYNFDSRFEVGIMNVNVGPGTSGLTTVILVALIIWIIAVLVQTTLLYFLGQKTPLGKVRIGT